MNRPPLDVYNLDKNTYRESTAVSTPLTIFITIVLGAAVLALIYFAVRQLIKAFEGDERNTPIQGQPLTNLCDCEAGSGKKKRYYHAITCRYRQMLEHKP